MNRLVPTSLVALALAGCGHDAHPRPATSSPSTPPVAVRPTCPAETAPVPAFRLTGDPNVAERLHPEVLPEPTRASCVQELDLLSQADSAPRGASTIETANGPILIVNRLRGMAVLPGPKLALLAADTGLWAHDTATMARLARLVPNRVVDVAATRDGARFAYVRQDPQTGETPAPRELVVVDGSTLAVLRRFSNAPEGRMRVSNDGTVVTFARGDDGVAVYDVASGRTSSFRTNNTIEDAFALPDRPGVVAYVGHTNALSFRDVGSGTDLPQSTEGDRPLVATRDLLSVIYEPSSRRILVGGADSKLHEYENMLGPHPADARQVQLHGFVVDIACCAEGSIVATTDSANVAWIKDGAIVREMGPLLPDLTKGDSRAAIVGNDTIVSTIGRVFTWTRDGFFLRPDFFLGEEIARATQGNSVVVVLSTRGWLEVHRYPSAGGVSVASTNLGRRDWATIDATFDSANDGRIFIGRGRSRVVAAIVPPTGDVRFVTGPRVGMAGHPAIAARGDGVHFAAWNLENEIVEIDATAGTVRSTHRIEGARPNAVTLSWAVDHWKVVDDTGAERTLTAIPEATPPATHP